MEVTHPPAKRVNVLGVGVSAINMDIALKTISDWIANRSHQYVCVTGVHGVMESQADEELKAIHNDAGLVTPDGTPLVWISRLNGHREVQRVYGPDLMLALCEYSVKPGFRHYFYGGNEGVPELLAKELASRFPGISIAGTFSPPFRELTAEEDEDVIEMINDSHADIVWVGLSTPKQERWMSAHVGKLDASVMIGVGAAFDFHAGLKLQAPIWMQRSGLEWLFRLATEPKRLWKRYLRNNPLFVGLFVAQMLRIKKYSLPTERRST